MFSLEALFCQVDDFCEQFEPLVATAFVEPWSPPASARARVVYKRNHDPPDALLGAYLQSRFGCCSGLSFVASTSLKVCHNRRIKGHLVCAG